MSLLLCSVGLLGSLPCAGGATSCRELGDLDVLFVQRVEASHQSWNLGTFRLFAKTTSQGADGFVKFPLVLFNVADEAFRAFDTSRRRGEKLSLDPEVLELTHPRPNIALERFRVLGLLLELLLCLVFLKFRHWLCATVNTHAAGHVVGQLVVGFTGVLADFER